MKNKSSSFKYRLTVSFCLMLITFYSSSQVFNPIEKVLSSLTVGPIPEDLLATKTIALFDPQLTTQELSQIQTGFERTGVDAVIYYPMDLPMCNPDVQKVFADYLNKREIKYMVFLKKTSQGVAYTFTGFNKSKSLITPGQAGWKMTGSSIDEVSADVYRTALNNQKRVNMLVSPTPEFNLTLRFIRGTRGEYFGLDLKVDKLGIVKTGNESIDSVMANILEENYPFKYQFFEPGIEETEIRQKGSLFVLYCINTRGVAAMDLLGYNTTKTGSAIASVSYPNGEMQLKTIDANQPVYKFYFKQIVNENIYLGTRWDADTDWKQALINQIKGLKKELRVN